MDTAFMDRVANGEKYSTRDAIRIEINGEVKGYFAAHAIRITGYGLRRGMQALFFNCSESLDHVKKYR